MAQKTTVTLVDDLDGAEADENVEFGIDGVSYEIDLTDTHAKALRDAFADYVACAPRTGGRRGTGRATRLAGASVAGSVSTTATREQNQAVREWARTQGMEVSDRGRIPASVTEAFRRRQ